MVRELVIGCLPPRFSSMASGKCWLSCWGVIGGVGLVPRS